MLKAEYIGRGLTPETYDELAFKHVGHDELAIERALFNKKWFDYRQLHPTEATYLYADHLVEQYRAAFRATIDHRASPFVRPFKQPDLFDNKQAMITALWRGRQTADALGMPYDTFLSLSFEHARRFWQRKHLPRPAQLYSRHERRDGAQSLLDRILASWEDHCAQILVFAKSEHYSNQAYVGTAAQNSHHEWLMEMVSKRGNSATLLSRFVFKDAILPEEKARARFGDDVFQRALDNLPRLAIAA